MINWNIVSAFFFPDISEVQELLPLSPRSRSSVTELSKQLLPPGEKPKRTSADYRALWKTAIHQQILLLRMEKENQRLEGESYMPNNLKTFTFGHIYDDFLKKCLLAFAFFIFALVKNRPILE